ncbi:putative integral membrane protein [Coniochaeta sp. 2T2.1]|nr:putative integral membrane protein [Coniochaeta sp. 2T2.1]
MPGLGFGPNGSDPSGRGSDRPHDNAGPKANIIAWTLMGFTTVFLALRIYCKHIGGRKLWWDDFLLIVTWAITIINISLATYLVTLGFGLYSWDFPTDNVGQLVLVEQVRAVFAITGTAWSKTTFAITLLRVTQEKTWERKFVWFIIVSMNIALGLSALLRWVQCTPIRKSWTPTMDGKCWPEGIMIDYDIFSGAYSALMDFVLAILPWKLIWHIRLRQWEKIGAAVAMSMGVFAGAVAIVKCTKLPTLLTGDIYDAVELFLWSTTEVCVTIMAASIPAMRVLIRDIKKTDRSRSDRLTYPSDYASNNVNPTKLHNTHHHHTAKHKSLHVVSGGGGPGTPKSTLDYKSAEEESSLKDRAGSSQTELVELREMEP